MFKNRLFIFSAALVTGAAAIAGSLVHADGTAPSTGCLKVFSDQRAAGERRIESVSDIVQEKRLRNLIGLIEGAYVPNKRLDKNVAKINAIRARAGVQAASAAQVAAALREANESEALCPIIGYTADLRPYRAVLYSKQARRVALVKLGGQPSSTEPAPAPVPAPEENGPGEDEDDQE